MGKYVGKFAILVVDEWHASRLCIDLASRLDRQHTYIFTISATPISARMTATFLAWETIHDNTGRVTGVLSAVINMRLNDTMSLAHSTHHVNNNGDQKLRALGIV